MGHRCGSHPRQPQRSPSQHRFHSPTRRHTIDGRLVFQQHYTPNGRAQTDITKVGLLFAEEKDITEERLTLIAIDQGFELHPETAGQKVKASIGDIPSGATLLGIAPHMHFRGNQFTATMVSNDNEEDLLHVPNYDFNWQHNYELSKPLDLSSGKGIETEFVFDNSKANPFNPDPSSYVTWGDQTWEEMAIAFFDVSRPRESKAVTSTDNTLLIEDKVSAARIQKKIEEQADKFLRKFDTDGDGLVQREDVPLTMQAREFRRCDANRDRNVDREELMTQFRKRIK